MSKLKVENFVIEYTGGGVYIAYGKFTNNLYFSIGCDIICIYDEDEYKAMEDDKYWNDPYEWEQKHFVKDIVINEKIHRNILKQIYKMCKDKYKDEMDLFRIGLE